MFALLSRVFKQMFGQIASLRVKTIGKTNLVASRHIKTEKGSPPVDEQSFLPSLLTALARELVCLSCFGKKHVRLIYRL